MAEDTKRSETARLVLAAEDALAIIAKPIDEKNEGFRHFVFGAPGMGKTHHARELVNWLLERRKVKLAVIHDVKGRVPEFDGDTRVNVDEFLRRLPDATACVFRGDARKDIDCDVEQVADLAWRLCRDSNQSVLFGINEFDDAVTDGGKSWRSKTARKCISQGRALGLSVLATTQQPARVPAEPLDQATSITFFRLQMRSLNYLSNVLMLEPEYVQAIAALKEREFLLWRPGVDYDGKVYKH